MTEIALIGNPNVGKTTLFNLLTGANQKIGNWPGVTVERKEGTFSLNNEQVRLVDLPGTYSLMVSAEGVALDEQIASQYVASQCAKLMINVIDASNLERNLYLTTQLLEMQVPMIVVLNMMDVVAKEHVKIDIQQLSQRLGCPVVPLEAVKTKQKPQLLAAITSSLAGQTHSSVAYSYPDAIEQAVSVLQQAESNLLRAQSVRLLEGDEALYHQQTVTQQQQIKQLQKTIQTSAQEDADILIAQARYAFVEQLVEQCVRQGERQGQRVTDWIDRIVLNRFLGIPIFLAVMYVMFLFAINIGGVFQDFFDIASDALFVSGPMYWLQSIHAPVWVTSVLANGVGKGINTVVTFIPVIAGMFFFLALLEQSGYMVRAAFVVDRLMRAIGLPGKSFVPMIVGFGCNVPAVLAARTLENQRDRILTVLMSPFMSCGARLAIFAVFIAAFFPQGGQNIVFGLYLIGIVVAVVTGLLLRKTILQGEPAPFILELPQYHIPGAQALWIHTWQRLKGFVLKAGKLIIPICLLLGLLNTLTLHGQLVSENNPHSMLAALGRVLTPIFEPMGVTPENWPATVGLLSGVLAKEVVVGTLNSLYSQAAHLSQVASFDLQAALWSAVSSIGDNIRHIGDSLLNPVVASMPDYAVDEGAMGQMYLRFGHSINAFAYLLFVLLYFPCVSTVAAMARELGKFWAIFSMLWTTGIAYGCAVFFYQAATLHLHPVASTVWMVAIIGFFLLLLLMMRLSASYGQQRGEGS